MLSVWNWILWLWLSALVIIFFTQIFNIFSTKKFLINLNQILIVLTIWIICFISAYFHNRSFDNLFWTWKITDNMWNNHYQLTILENNKKIYITTKIPVQIWDIISLNKTYRQHWQSCQQCLFDSNIRFWLTENSFERYLFVNWYDWSSFENYPKIIGNEKNIFETTRTNIAQKIDNSFDNSWLLKWLLLWDKASMNPIQKQEFKNAWLLHLMVASGWNIALLSSFIAIIFFFLPFYARLILAAIIAILYSLMIWLDIPIARALVMSVFSTLAILSWRVTQSLQWLLVAFLIFWLINPYSIWYDLSFQLSFLAVLGIILFNRLNFVKNKLWKNLLSMILTPIWASVFTFWIIVTIWKYNILSILTNIVASWIVAILSYLGIMSLFTNQLQNITNFFSNILLQLAQISNEKWIYITLMQNHYIEFLICWFIILASIYFLWSWNKKSV